MEECAIKHWVNWNYFRSMCKWQQLRLSIKFQCSKQPFLGTFTKLQRVSISFVVSACLSVLEQLYSHWVVFVGKIWYLGICCDIIWLRVFYCQTATKGIKILSIQDVTTSLMQCFALLLKVRNRETWVFKTWKNLVERKGVRTINFFHSYASIQCDMNISFWLTVLTYITPHTWFNSLLLLSYKITSDFVWWLKPVRILNMCC